MNLAEEKFCYNKGCGKKYNEHNNKDDSCLYHKGDPIFHDAYKYWSCCSKKHSNFTDFLNTPGCCKGKHSNIKPVTLKPKKEEKVTYLVKSKEDISNERPSLNEPLSRLNSIIDPLYESANIVSKSGGINGNAPSMGDTCRHHSCNVTYSNALKDDSPCLFHSGQPIFHEGMKYWSCCQRRTTDFTTFLNQKGCEEGKHQWDKKDEVSLPSECKLDWYQTASHIFITIYTKNPDPGTSFIDANRVSLKCHIEYSANGIANICDKTIILKEPINVCESQVIYQASKVEIKMRKSQNTFWQTLCMHTY